MLFSYFVFHSEGSSNDCVQKETCKLYKIFALHKSHTLAAASLQHRRFDIFFKFIFKLQRCVTEVKQHNE